MAAIIDQVELSEAPTIILAGEQWKIPMLAVRQNKRIIPAVMSLNGIKFETLTEEQADKLYTICYIAVTRARPDLSRDQFEDMPVTLTEAFRAFPIIVKQAGMAATVNPEGNPGPAAAPATLPGSIGKKSSSRSVVRKG